MPVSHALDLLDPAAARGLWVVNDGVMGGVSRSHVRHTPEGVVFEGEVSLENNGGFASLRAPASFPSGSAALELRARGDGKRYKFLLRTDPSARAPLYECAFTAAPGWETHRFVAGDFAATFRGRAVEAPPLDLARATELGILIADRQAGPFRIQLAGVRAVPAALPAALPE